MTSAEQEVLDLWEKLHAHCAAEIKKIEAICNEHGIHHYFRGLPPFDDYGNSGWYLPVKPDGEGWRSSEELNDEYGYHAKAGDWVSSDTGC